MINLTLVGQAIAFAILVWFCMKFVWPPLIGAIDERQRKIAEGLSAAEQARADLTSAEAKVAEEFARAQSEASAIVDRAGKTANQMIEDAKLTATHEGERILASARTQGEAEVARARNQLRSEVAGLAVLGAERILHREIDAKAHDALLDDLVAKL